MEDKMTLKAGEIFIELDVPDNKNLLTVSRI